MAQVQQFQVHTSLFCILGGIRFSTACFVDHAVKLLLLDSKGTLMDKKEIKKYLSHGTKLLIHPDVHHLVGLHWKDTLYADKALPLGLRSALKISTAVYSR